mgnify:CR=1 FL=1
MNKLFLILLFSTSLAVQSQPQEYYLIKEYQINQEYQSQILEPYFEKAYLPTLKRVGIEAVGVFKNIELEGVDNQSFNNSYFLLIPFSDLNQLETLEESIFADKTYQSSAEAYINAAHDQPPYARIVLTVLKAFEDHPRFKIPDLSAPKSERIYELRSYESPTETFFVNKVKMFNAGDEIGLFSKLNFNAAFYGEVLAGSNMPNLMYMTAFNNREERDQKWKQFVDDPQWKKLIGDNQYDNNVSKADLIFLKPLPFSDF